MKYLDQIDLSGKRVFVRVDFNVPMDKSGNVTDATRVKASLATINYIREKGARVIVASHLGRPKGKRVDEFSLKPVALVFSALLKKDVPFVDDCIGEKAQQAVAAMKAGDVILLENLRFHAGEDKNDDAFAQELAKLCDVYVNDAFAVSHRAAASNTAITKFVPVSAAGFLLKNEIEYFNKAMGNPARPLVAIIGGAKVSDKIKVLENVIDKVDRLIVGGGMAFTFLKAQGGNIGKSLCETDMLDLAKTIMDKAKAKNVQFLLPVDAVIAPSPAADAATKVVDAKNIPEDQMGLDIGPASIAAFSDAVKSAKTIVWNGPLGMFELAPFAKGTFTLVDAAVASGALTIVGGGPKLFGDPTADYQEALNRHYSLGTPQGWQERFVSSYATMHPAEDWAETFAHYLHIRDTLDTSAWCGFAPATATFDRTIVGPSAFATIIEMWLPLSWSLNMVNRSMGHDDLYPFVLPPAVLEKMQFIHTVIDEVASAASGPAAITG